MQYRPSFRPFMVELQAAAGSHDTESVTVIREYASNLMVIHHENIHGGMFFSTPDGQLLAVMMQLKRSFEEGNQAPSEVHTTLQNLIASSLKAHEATATYLGIKLLSSVEQAEALRTLDSDYCGYYQQFGEVVDPWSPASFMQYLLARKIAYVLFSSPMLAQFVKLGLSHVTSYQLGESPNDRLELLRKVIRHNGLELRKAIDTWANDACLQLGLPMWDLDSEEAWMANEPHREQLEESLSSKICKWLEDKSGLPVLTGDEHAQALTTLASQVKPYLLHLSIFQMMGDNQCQRLTGDDLFQLAFLQDLVPFKGAQAWWESSSLIANPNRKRLSRYPDDLLLAQGGPFSFSLHSFLLLSEPPPDNLLEWTILAWSSPPAPGKNPNIGGRFSREAVLSWLRGRRDYEVQHAPVAKQLVVVLAVQNWQDWIELHSSFLAATSFQDDQGNVYREGAKASCWYWCGHWMDVLLRLKDFKQSKAEIWTLAQPSIDRVIIQGVDVQTSAWLPDFVIKVLSIPGVPGYMIRALNFDAHASVRRVEKRLLQAGALAELRPEKREEVAEVVSYAITAISLLWDR